MTLREALENLVGKRAAALVEELAERDGLAAVRRMTEDELVASGLSRKASGTVLAAVALAQELDGARLRRGGVFRSSRDIFRTYRWMRDLRQEQFRALLLDGKHKVIRDVLVSQGTLTTSPVHPRETFGAAMREGAAAVVLVHNHPSGIPTPSMDDLEVTRRLVDVGRLVGIQVLDHVIIGDGTYTSFVDRGIL